MNGNIPVLSVQECSMALTWEKSLLVLHEQGCRVRTEYDRKDKDGNWADPPSVDATMLMTVEDPESEPAIHRAFPGGLEDLEEYRMEVVEGVKRHWIRDPHDPSDTRWEYTYYGRLNEYDVPNGRFPINQLHSIVRKLAKTPHSRRVQAIVWQPWKDEMISDPPCLQSIWCRMLRDDEHGCWRLNMNVRFRSRDAFDAAFMNMWAFAGPGAVQGKLAEQIGREMGQAVRCGRYCDLSDSYHIYGSRLAAFEEGFLKLVEVRSLEERTWTREFAQPFFDEARPAVIRKVAEYDAEHGRGGRT